MNVLAIIPARGGSKGIPRKNARLLGGLPLVAHAIRACLGSRRITRTVVSTEDEEIGVVARRFGAEVVKRDPDLAGDDIPLAPVVHRVVTDLEAGGFKPDVVATVQPTSPLIRSETIDRALAIFEEADVDTVLSVYDNTHLNWTQDAAGRARPLFEARVNRQLLPRILTESGGLIASRRSVVTARERIGDKVRLVELGRDEAIDIDTVHDWWLAEKVLARRRIVFHVIGSREAGLGHVYRALALARRLTDHEVAFVAADSEGSAIEMIRASHFEVRPYHGGAIQALETMEPDVVVNDVLDTEAPLVRAMREHGWRVVNFEDRGPGAGEADAVVNALYGAPDAAAKVYGGSDYYCLREEFYSVRRREVRPTVENLLLAFGGTDPAGLTVKVAGALRRVRGTFRVTVILGAGYRDEARLEAALGKLEVPWEVVRDTKVISDHMERADVMVTSAGRTVYEAAAIGVPTLVLCQNERELEHVFASREHGFVNLGLGSEVSPQRIASELGKLMARLDLRREMQYHMWQWDYRGGIERVLRIILGDAEG